LKLPSDYIMDNLIFYGEYEIIGHRKILNEELDFPISYGKRINFGSKEVFLQWGFIHIEKPIDYFSKYLSLEGEAFSINPYGYYSIGFDSAYGNSEIANCLQNNGKINFSNVKHFKAKYDLRNPENNKIKAEIFQKFGLDPDKNYIENSLKTSTALPEEIIKKLK